MPSRFAVAVLLVLVAWPAELSATLVVALRASNGIVVAADSLRGTITRTGERGYTLACKIRDFGHIVFAAAGDSRATGPFSLDAITANLRQEGVPLWDRVRSFDHKAEVAFNEVHNGRPETGSVSFTYILGFMLEGLPFAYTRQFKSSGGEVEIGAREELATGEVIFMGQPDIADHLSSVEAPDVQGPVISLASLLVRVVNRQAQRMPTKVGGPVDVIALTADGTQWAHREPESKCADRE